jgi:hypothetical protein
MSSIDILQASLFTFTPNSSQIRAAVSKSMVELIFTMILFAMNFFINSGNVTHIFSENSFTLIESPRIISCFLISVPEVAASFLITGVVGV